MRIISVLIHLFIIAFTALLTSAGAKPLIENMDAVRTQEAISSYAVSRDDLPKVTSGGKLIFFRNVMSQQKEHPKRIVEHQLIRPQPDMHSILPINPPTFRWPEHNKGAQFLLEISSNKHFISPLRIQTNEIFYRPLLPLKPGHWWWRFRETGKSWSKTIEFDVTEETTRWPIPEWQSLISRVPKQRPRIFIRPEDVKSYKIKAMESLSELVTEWENHLGNKDYITKKEAKFNRFLHKTDDPKVARRRKHEYTNAKAGLLAGRIPDLCWVWMMTGDDRWADEAKDLTLQSLDIISPDSSQSHPDFANSTFVSAISIAYDMLYKMFTEEEKARIRNILLDRTRLNMTTLLSVPSKLFYNHGWQHTFLESMIVALALAGEEKEADKWLEGGLRRFIAFYPWFGGADGGSAEGASYFLSSDILGSMRIRDFFYTTFGIDFAQNNPWFRNSIYYLIYAYPPGGIKSMLGDVSVREASYTPGGRTAVIARRMGDLLGSGFAVDYDARTGTRNYGKWYIDPIRWLPFNDIERKSLEELPKSRLFSDIGVAFMHSDITQPDTNVRLEFRSSPFGAYAHAHADQNSFNIIAGNKPLIVDSGYYDAYGSEHHKKWSTQSVAHNTVLIDGVGQDRKKPYYTRGYGRIIYFLDTNNLTYVMGSANTAYTDIALNRFDRHLVWLKGTDIQTYIIIDDIETADNLTHHFDWMIHANNEMLIDQKNNFLFINNGNSHAKVSLLRPQQLEISQHNKFTADPKDYQNHPAFRSLLPQWHLRAQAINKKSVNFIAIIQVAHSGQVFPDITESEGAFSVDNWNLRINGNKVEIWPTAN